MKDYAAVLSIGATRWSYLIAIAARLPIAMIPLGLLVLFEATTGRYSSGGLVAGAFSLGAAASGPLWGRALDRGSHATVISLTSVVSGLLLLVCGLSGVYHWPLWLSVLSSLFVGLFFPPITPAIRTAWPHLLDHRAALLAAAYALDAVAVESLFVIGPIVISLLITFGPSVPVFVTACILGFAGLCYAQSPAGRVHGEGGNPRAADAYRSAVLRPRVVRVLGVATLMAIGFGMMDVAITATAQRTYQNESILGLLFALVAAGSITGGLGFGAWSPRYNYTTLALALGGYGLALLSNFVALTMNVHLIVLIPLLVTTGLFLSPSLLVMQQFIDDALAIGCRAEGQAWLGAVLTAGGAMGVALGGFVADQLPAYAVYGFAASSVLLGALVSSVYSLREARTSIAPPSTPPKDNGS